MSSIHPARFAAALLAAPLALALAACTTAGEPTTTSEPTPVNGSPPLVIGGDFSESCDAKAAEQYVGQVLDEALGERAKAATGARGVRVIRPGMAVTMDYRPGRLNIELDEAGRIVRFRCG